MTSITLTDAQLDHLADVLAGRLAARLADRLAPACSAPMVERVAVQLERYAS